MIEIARNDGQHAEPISLNLPPTLCFVVTEGFDIICLYLQHLFEHLWLRMSDALAPHSPCIYTFSILRCKFCLFLRLKKETNLYVDDAKLSPHHMAWHGSETVKPNHHHSRLIHSYQPQLYFRYWICSHVLFGHVILFALRLLVILLFLVIFWQHIIQPE